MAAEAWLRGRCRANGVTRSELWEGLCQEYPDLTTPSEKRKTPRATCMRDIRKDEAFDVSRDLIGLRRKAENVIT